MMKPGSRGSRCANDTGKVLSPKVTRRQADSFLVTVGAFQVPQSLNQVQPVPA